MGEIELEEGPVAGEQPPTTVRLKPRVGFVGGGQVQEIAERAMFYLNAGYPVHFSGPAGTGKTTLAMHVVATCPKNPERTVALRKLLEVIAASRPREPAPQLLLPPY